MGDEKLQAFRWKGPGVLHIQRAAGERRVVPAYEPGQIEKACIVKDPENLAALGAARITEFIASKQAEPVNWVEGLAGMLKEDSPEALVDAKQADEIAQKAAKDSASVAVAAKAEKKAGNPRANAEAESSTTPSAMAPVAAAPAGPKK